MAELLAAQEIEERLGALEDWRREGDALVRDLEFADFAAAIALVNARGRASPRRPTTTPTSSCTAGTRCA